jgi:hypothetical protein
MLLGEHHRRHGGLPADPTDQIHEEMARGHAEAGDECFDPDRW